MLHELSVQDGTIGTNRSCRPHLSKAAIAGGVREGAQLFVRKKWRPGLAADAAVRPTGFRDYPADTYVYFDGDMRPVRSMNDWIADICVAKALTTVNTYSGEVARFANFLETEFDTTLLSPDMMADGDRFLKSYNALLVRADASSADSLGAVGKSKSVVGKVRAALKSYYEFCLNDGRVSTFPFSLVTTRTRHGEITTMRHMQGGRITDSFRDPIPSSQLKDYYRVGLLGLLPNGAPDDSFGSWETAQRNAAGFGLGVGLGLRHREILGTTVFEVPPAHPDGLTPARVAGAIAKGRRGRRVVGLSDWLVPVHRYIAGDRRLIARRATWRPERAWVVIPERTSRTELVVITPSGREETLKWSDLGHEQRRKLVMPQGGTPMVLLDHSKKNGAPLTDDDSLNAALSAAGARCQRYWPAQQWSYTAHNLRHTFATELTMFLADSERFVARFVVDHGRPPTWASMLERQDKSRVVQDSMGHRDIETTNHYREAAMWSMLMSATADPNHNPAVREAAL